MPRGKAEFSTMQLFGTELSTRVSPVVNADNLEIPSVREMNPKASMGQGLLALADTLDVNSNINIYKEYRGDEEVTGKGIGEALKPVLGLADDVALAGINYYKGKSKKTQEAPESKGYERGNSEFFVGKGIDKVEKNWIGDAYRATKRGVTQAFTKPSVRARQNYQSRAVGEVHPEVAKMGEDEAVAAATKVKKPETPTPPKPKTTSEPSKPDQAVPGAKPEGITPEKKPLSRFTRGALKVGGGALGGAALYGYASSGPKEPEDVYMQRGIKSYKRGNSEFVVGKGFGIIEKSKMLDMLKRTFTRGKSPEVGKAIDEITAQEVAKPIVSKLKKARILTPQEETKIQDLKDLRESVAIGKQNWERKVAQGKLDQNNRQERMAEIRDMPKQRSENINREIVEQPATLQKPIPILHPEPVLKSEIPKVTEPPVLDKPIETPTKPMSNWTKAGLIVGGSALGSAAGTALGTSAVSRNTKPRDSYMQRGHENIKTKSFKKVLHVGDSDILPKKKYEMKEIPLDNDELSAVRAGLSKAGRVVGNAKSKAGAGIKAAVGSFGRHKLGNVVGKDFSDILENTIRPMATTAVSNILNNSGGSQVSGPIYTRVPKAIARAAVKSVIRQEIRKVVDAPQLQATEIPSDNLNLKIGDVR